MSLLKKWLFNLFLPMPKWKEGHWWTTARILNT